MLADTKNLASYNDRADAEEAVKVRGLRDLKVITSNSLGGV